MTGKIVPLARPRPASRRVPVEVIAYSGYRADQSPRSFTLEGIEHPVAEVLSRWREESEKERGRTDFFEVTTTDGAKHVLGHEADTDRWFLVRSDT